MNTKTLLTKQKEEAKTYLDAFKFLPHSKSSVYIMSAAPLLLWITCCILIWSPAYNKLLTLSWIIVAYNSFSYYNLIFSITTYATLAYLTLSSIIESFRFKSFLEIANCTRSLKKVLQQTENAEEPNACNYSFNNVLFSNDVFSQCAYTLKIIKGESNLLMRIVHYIRFFSFVIMTIGMTLVVTIPLSIIFSQCQLFNPVEFDLTRIFIIIAIVVSIMCSCGLLLTAFIAQTNTHLINPLIFLTVFASAILISTSITLAIPGMIAIVCWIIYGVITAAIAVITAIVGIIVTILSGLFELAFAIAIIAVIISILSEL